MLAKSTSCKLVCAALAILLLVESVSAIIGHSKGKRKHKDDDDDDDDYDDSDPTCYPGRNCKPGCYCSGETCRPVLYPKNAAEAKWKCKPYNYPRWKLWRKGSKDDGLNNTMIIMANYLEKSYPGITSLLMKNNFNQYEMVTSKPRNESKLEETLRISINGTDRPTESDNDLDYLNSTASPKPAHPSQRSFRLLYR